MFNLGFADRKSPVFRALSVVGIIAASMLGAYVGPVMLVPVLCFVAAWIATKHFAKPTFEAYRVLFSIQAGHALWIVAAFASILLSSDTRWYWDLTPGRVYYYIDALILIAALVFLALRPGRLALWILMVYQVLSTLTNIGGLLVEIPGSFMHRAIALHVLFRVSAIVVMTRQLLKRPADRQTLSENP